MSEDEQRNHNLIIFGCYLTDKEMAGGLKNWKTGLIVVGMLFSIALFAFLLTNQLK